MTLVIDASVAVKWILPDTAREPNADRAVELLNAVRAKQVELLQPPHWLAEVAAVISRMQPEIADQAIDLLVALEFAVEADVAIYKRACRIAAELGQHVFDTLYHSLALERGAVLVTADDRYLRRASALGHAVSLQDWVAPRETAQE